VINPKVKKANSLRVSLFNFARSSLYYLTVSVTKVSTATGAVGVTTAQESTQTESHLVVSVSGAPVVHDANVTANNTAKSTFFIVVYYLVFISAEADLFCRK